MNSLEAIQRLREVIRRQHKALSTESCYVYWLSKYMSRLGEMHKTLSSAEKIERFLTELACKRDVAASTQNQALNALVFFYREVLRQPIENVNALRAKQPIRMRHAPTISETQVLLRTIRDEGGYPTNLIARILYGCGLPVTEPLNLRIKDVNFHRSTLCIRGAKGGKDRIVSLPTCLAGELMQQIEFAKVVWQRDSQNAIPVMLPQRLAVKYPEYQFVWPWAWVFPAHRTCTNPNTGSEVRFRMHEVNVQRAMKHARRKLGISVLRMNSDMGTPPIAWNRAQILGPSRKRWATNRWKPRWLICTRTA